MSQKTLRVRLDQGPEVEAADTAKVVQFFSQSCRQCGCTETSACMTETGPCYWAESDLCSGCADGLNPDLND